MFSKSGPNTVVSDEGFSVQVLGRTGLKYTEGTKEMRVDSVVLAGPHGMVVYSASVRTWAPPHQEEVVDEYVRARIIENIKRAFKFEGFDIDVF
jgi:hypothetical protein